MSCLVGLTGALLLWPTMLLIALWIRLTSYGTVFSLIQLSDDSSRSVLCFSCEGPVGDFLRGQNLHMLPAVIDLGLGRVSMWELIRLDWRG